MDRTITNEHNHLLRLNCTPQKATLHTLAFCVDTMGDKCPQTHFIRRETLQENNRAFRSFDCSLVPAAGQLRDPSGHRSGCSPPPATLTLTPPGTPTQPQPLHGRGGYAVWISKPHTSVWMRLNRQIKL